MVARAGRPRPQLSDDTPEARRSQAKKLAYKRGGVTKYYSTLIYPAPAHRSTDALELLRGTHPSKDQAVIATCKVAIIGGGQDSPVPIQDTIIEVEELFCPEDVRATFQKVNS